jgi:hypothetical protein
MHACLHIHTYKLASKCTHTYMLQQVQSLTRKLETATKDTEAKAKEASYLEEANNELKKIVSSSNNDMNKHGGGERIDTFCYSVSYIFL